MDKAEEFAFLVDGQWPSEWRRMDWSKTMENLIKEGWPGFKVRRGDNGKFVGTHSRKHELDADTEALPWMEGRERKSVDRLTPDCETREEAIALAYNVAVHAAMREIQRRNEEEGSSVGYRWDPGVESWVGFDRVSENVSSGGPLLHALIWCIQQTARRRTKSSLDRVLD